MSNIVIEDLRKKIAKNEELLKDPGISEWRREDAEKALAHSKKRLAVLEKADFSQTTNDMKAILSHTKSVEEKYECRSVKGMFWLARFASFFSKSLGEKIQNYTVKEIHSPVCSIVSSPKPELPPMPNHVSPLEHRFAAERARDRDELKRFQSLTNDWMTYKPIRWERFKAWCAQVKEVFTIRKGEPVMSEAERIALEQKTANAWLKESTQKGKV